MPEDFCHIYRCIEYKNTLFRFGLYRGEYYSIKHQGWIDFTWKCPKNIKQESLLEMPYDFFVNKATIAYEKELFIIENRDIHNSFSPINYTKKINFVCGSKPELERLTRLAAFTLAELQPLFEHFSSFQLIYESENEYHYGGINQEIDTEDYNDEVILSKKAQQLFNLIFEYNFFTGLSWEYNDGHGYTGYNPISDTIEVDIQAPSQHERLEAALELQSWLEGKLPDEEIQAYFD